MKGGAATLASGLAPSGTTQDYESNRQSITMSTTAFFGECTSALIFYYTDFSGRKYKWQNSCPLLSLLPSAPKLAQRPPLVYLRSDSDISLYAKAYFGCWLTRGKWRIKVGILALLGRYFTTKNLPWSSCTKIYSCSPLSSCHLSIIRVKIEQVGEKLLCSKLMRF